MYEPVRSSLPYHTTMPEDFVKIHPSTVHANDQDVYKRQGYGYQVKNGATTLTEEWDGPDPNRPHGSQNHLMLGSIDEWFFAGLGGIGSIRTNQEFNHVTICPHIAENMDCLLYTSHICPFL